MSRIVDKPYFTYSAYNALTSGIQVKCPKCHGAGVVTADEDNAYFRCLSCGHQETRDRTIYRYDVHNQCKNCGRYYRVDIEDEAKQQFSVLHVACPYTYGMDVFGKEEMEVLNTDAEPEELRDFLASLASYVLACDVTLQDGETIGFSADDKHTITRSPGVSLPEEQMTLKIGYEPIKGDPEDDDDSIGMDDVSYHIENLEEKELPIDPINAYNHMAIYLRWCMEHDLMGGKFLAEHGEVVNQVKADPGNTDLRTFIREELFGCLFSALFNQKGRAFAHYYYGEIDAPYYPADIDDYALKYFGPSRYHSNEFQQEAYLFIPFDEDYYQAMAEVIEERFTNWQGQDFDEDTLEPSEVAQAICSSASTAENTWSGWILIEKETLLWDLTSTPGR